MSILGISKTYRRWNRLVEIIQVVTKHGFVHYVQRLNIEQNYPRLGGWLAVRTRMTRAEETEETEENLARRATLVFQELGPTFVKLGQMLSSRPDIVSEDFIDEFKTLQDQVEPFPGDQAREIIEAAFGQPIEEIFSSFEQEAFASGSIAQAHYATLQDGTKVVLKVRRPDIEDRVMMDLSWLRYLADLAEQYIPELQLYRPAAIVEELERAVRREMDLVIEASFTAKFYDLFKEDKNIRTPRVYWDLTSPDVITLERIDGTNIGEFARNEESPHSRRQLAHALAGAFCRQYFEFGTFHADPHPGNLLVEDGNQLALIDFGMVGQLNPELKNNLTSLLIALDQREIEIFCSLFSELGATSDATHFNELQNDVLEMIDKYYNMPLKRIDTLRVFSDVTRIARGNSIILPRDIIMLAKSFVGVMTTAKNLDPDFDFAVAIEPHVRALVTKRLSPKHALSEAKSSLWHVGRLLRWLPRELSEILHKVEGGRLQFVFRHVGLDHMSNELDRSLNRLSISIIIAAIVIASSLLLQAEVQPLVGHVSILGLLGYVVASFLGFTWVYSIWRSGRL